MEDCDRAFYASWRILQRVARSLWNGCHPLISLIGNLSFRGSIRSNHKAYRDFLRRPAIAPSVRSSPAAMALKPANGTAPWDGSRLATPYASVDAMQ